jgi:hypothetical protein
MNKTGSLIRKGTAMLKRNTLNITISYRPYDLQGTSMPTAEKLIGLFLHASLRPDQVDI